MNDNESNAGQSPSAWDVLAEQLGANPSPEASQRHQPKKATESTSSSETADREKPPETPQPAPSDWDGLAHAFGLEVPEPKPSAQEPPVVEPTVESSASSAELSEARDDLDSVSGARTSDESLPSLPSAIDQALSESAEDRDEAASDEQQSDEMGISGEAARDAFDSLFANDLLETDAAIIESQADQTPLEFSETTPLESAELDAAPEALEDSEQAKKRRPRRRRGRGGRGSGNQRSNKEPLSSDEAPAEEASAERVDQDSEKDDIEDQEKKPRRRRSPKRVASAETNEGKAAAASDHDEDGADSPATPRTAAKSRARHRNLPTWAEAIGVIVETNLQQRSKTPAKPSSPRGRGRGGRRRKKSS